MALLCYWVTPIYPWAADKPMDVFGGAWVGYVDKLRAGLPGG